MKYLCLAVGLSLMVSSCASSSKSTSPTEPTPVGTPYRGVFGAGSVGGALLLTVSSTGSVSGTLTPQAGSAVTVSGTFDSTSGAFAATGSSWRIDALLIGSRVAGTAVAPDGRVAPLAALALNGSQTATANCGTYAGSSTGAFRFVVADVRLAGVAGETSSVLLDGVVSASGDSASISWLPGPGDTATATVTRSGTAWSGNWSSTQESGGSIQATACTP